MTNITDLGTKKMTCEKHGEYTAHGTNFLGSDHWTGCEKCDDEHEEVAEAVGVARSNRSKGVPERYANATMRNYVCTCDKQRKIVAELVNYIRMKRRPNLIIHGGMGTGKTHLMWALVKAVSGAHYTKASELIRRVKCTMGDYARENEADIVRELSTVPLLVIDEIGRQGGTPFEVNFIFDLIDNRYNNFLPTVFVSNLPLSSESGPSITSFVGAAVIDRINEESVEMVFDWENYRALPVPEGASA